MRPRNPLTQTLLSFFVPLYIVYWSYVTAKEIETTYHFKAPHILLLLAPLIIMVAGFVALISGGVLSSNDEANFAAGLGFFIGFLLFIPLTVVLSLVYYYKLSDNVEKIFGPQQASRLLLFILFWFISPAAVYIIQEKLNTLTAAPAPIQNT